MFDTAPQELLILAQALLALLLGGLVGAEREAAGKWAGLRTHMLVCLGAFLFVKTGELITLSAVPLWQAAGLPDSAVRSDPIRIVQSIAVGIAFVGAGVVFRDPERHATRGLTTAATLLVVAPIGIAVAIERYVLAAGAALLVVLVLRGLTWVERKVFKSDHVDAD